MAENEISHLVHQFETWQTWESKMVSDHPYFSLIEPNLPLEDLWRVKTLVQIYLEELIDSSKVVEIVGKQKPGSL